VTVGVRWLLAVGASLTGFAACWLGLAIAHTMDTGTQVGLASVPLAVVLTVVGAWAERARERSVDLIGVWADPPETALGMASVRINVRNGSELPVLVEELAFELRSKWKLPPVRFGKSEDLYANLQMGTPAQFLIGDFGRVPPHETRNREYRVDLAEVAPKGSRSLYHMWCVVKRVGLVDDAGRGWWVQPNRAGRVKRVRAKFGRTWKPPWPAAHSTARDGREEDSAVGTASDGP
jgi:hypothetical protein